MMTRRDFELVAAGIKAVALGVSTSEEELAHHYREEYARAVAGACAVINPRFDRARFLKACGVDE